MEKSVVWNKIPWNLIVIVCYGVGLSWFVCHPIMSVVTGEFHKCRGIYIDEQQLEIDTLYHHSSSSSPIHRNNNNNNICDQINIHCHTTNNNEDNSTSLSTITVLPPHRIPTEAIVILYHHDEEERSSSKNYNNFWNSLIMNLSQKPWLTKSFVFVSSSTMTLEEMVESYIVSSSSYIIRQLLVFKKPPSSSIHNNNKDDDYIEILPQSRRGVLPNLDLVFATVQNFQYTSYFSQIYVHPYHTHPLYQQLSSSSFFTKIPHLIDMMAFMLTMIREPFPPHDMAMQRGIDSITIQYSGKNDVPVLNLLRGLNSLQERLHHSTPLYLLPSSTKFVSNNEYILPPIIFGILPLLIRTILLAFRDLKSSYQFQTTFSLLFYIVLTSITLLYLNYYTTNNNNNDDDNINMIHTILILLYGSILYNQHHKRDEIIKVTRKQSIQIMACLLTIYSHIPLLFGHISLGIPSTFLWSLLFSQTIFFTNNYYLGLPICFLTWPGHLITYHHIFSSYTPYICLVYVPLHLLFTILCF